MVATVTLPNLTLKFLSTGFIGQAVLYIHNFLTTMLPTNSAVRILEENNILRNIDNRILIYNFSNITQHIMILKISYEIKLYSSLFRWPPLPSAGKVRFLG